MAYLPKRCLALAVAVVAGLAGAPGSFACIVTSTTPTVRAEGTVEFLGTITLSCGFTAGDPVPTATPNTSVTVTLQGANFSPVAIGTVLNNTANFPPPILTSTLALIGTPSVLAGGAIVTFYGFTPTAGAQTVTISGLRANLASSGLTANFLTASVAFSGGFSGPSAVVTSATVQRGLGINTGFFTPGLGFCRCPIPTSATGEPLATVPRNPDPSETTDNSIRVTLEEGFATAFRTAANEDGGTPGLQGTRFRIVLAGIPTGITPFAPRALRSTSAATTGAVSPFGAQTVLQRVAFHSADGSGGSVLPEVADQFDAIPVSGGTVTLVYEVTQNDLSLTESLSLFLVLTGSPGEVSTVTGSISFAPLGPPTELPARPQFASKAGGGLGAPATLSVSATALRFQAPVGSNPPPQSLRITNSGGGVLNWAVVFVSIAGGNWLSFSPANGQGDATVVVTVTGATLAPGTYSATLNVLAPGASNSPGAVTVTLTVQSKPTLFSTPSSLSFAASPGSASPPPQSLAVTSSEAGLNWTAAATTSSGGNWLSLSLASGVTPATVMVSVNPAGLAEGTYRGAITISAPDASNSLLTVNVTLFFGTPTIRLNPSSVVFSTSVGRNPPLQTVSVQNAGTGVLGWTATVSTQSGGNWLSANPTSAVAPSFLSVVANATGLAPGVYVGTVTIAAVASVTASNSPQTLPVTLVIDAPVLSSGGVVNAASFSGESGLSPGSIATIFGTRLAGTTATAPSLPLPFLLADAQVLVNNAPAPLFYVSPTQINFQMPFALSGSTAEIVVVSSGIRGLAASVRLEAATPGIFSAAGSGSGQAAALNEDFSANSPQNAISAGGVLQLFATGLGNTSPPVGPGQPASAAPLSVTALTPVLLVGGASAEVLFSGLAPGLAGAYQVNVRVPPGLPPSSAAPVQLQIGDRVSNTVTIAVR